MKKLFRLISMAAAIAAGMIAQPCFAQLTFPTAASGVRAPASVPLQCDASAANCAPPSSANPGVIAGNIASSATDAGNPVKVGGRYNVTSPTFTDGQRGDVQLDSRGNLRVTLMALNGNSGLSVLPVTDTQAGTNGLSVNGQTQVFNGATYDRLRNNVDTAALITHAAASAGTQSADQVNYNGRGVKLVIDITAITGTSPTLTVTLQGKDAASGKYYTLLASAALTATGTYVLEVYPGIAVAANASASATVPRTWRVSTVIGGTTPAVTATVGASVIL